MIRRATGTTRRMVLWGVRINESRDDHDFYASHQRAGARAGHDPAKPAASEIFQASEFLETSSHE